MDDKITKNDDADTVAAVAGGLAGTYFRINDIPQKWIDALQRKDHILEMCNKFTDFVVREV